MSTRSFRAHAAPARRRRLRTACGRSSGARPRRTSRVGTTAVTEGCGEYVSPRVPDSPHQRARTIRSRASACRPHAVPVWNARRADGVSAVYDDAVIAEAARRILDAAPGAQVILFGSHVRGAAHVDSDLDLLVVEPQVRDASREEVRLRRALRGLGLFATSSWSAARTRDGFATCRGAWSVLRWPRDACSRRDQ